MTSSIGAERHPIRVASRACARISRDSAPAPAPLWSRAARAKSSGKRKSGASRPVTRSGRDGSPPRGTRRPSRAERDSMGDERAARASRKKPKRVPRRRPKRSAVVSSSGSVRTVLGHRRGPASSVGGGGGGGDRRGTRARPPSSSIAATRGFARPRRSRRSSPSRSRRDCRRDPIRRPRPRPRPMRDRRAWSRCSSLMRFFPFLEPTSSTSFSPPLPRRARRGFDDAFPGSNPPRGLDLDRELVRGPRRGRGRGWMGVRGELGDVLCPAAIPKKISTRREGDEIRNPRLRRVGIASRRLRRARPTPSRRGAQSPSRAISPRRSRPGAARRPRATRTSSSTCLARAAATTSGVLAWPSDAVGSAGGVLLGVSSASARPRRSNRRPDARSGPWLAACGGRVVRTVRSSFVVAAEPDDEVSSAGAADPLGDGGAWGLVARAPITIQTALPCACAYVITYSRTRAIAARGIASPGEPARYSPPTRDKRSPRTRPADDPREIAGAKGRRLAHRGRFRRGRARAENQRSARMELRSRSAEGHAAGANAVARFAVTVE